MLKAAESPDLPVLTVLVGPETPVALALNDFVRRMRGLMALHGLAAVPNRRAGPVLRQAANSRVAAAARLTALHDVTGAGPAFLSAVKFLGLPRRGFRGRSILPGVAVRLAGLGELGLGAGLRLVIAPAALPAFFLATGSEATAARVSATPWETLYELSWAALADEIAEALPGAEISVLAPRRAATRSPEVLAALFGPAAAASEEPWALLASALDETGRAVLAEQFGGAPPSPAVAEELLDSFPAGPGRAELRAQLGIDDLTATLLEQRLYEDLRDIRASGRVRLV